MRRALLIPVLVAIALLAGCSVLPVNVLTEDQRIELRDAASQYQQLVLADLFVDEAEYRQAMNDWHSCVGSAGAEPSAVKQDGNQLGFDFSIEAPTDTEVAAIHASADICLPEYFDAIGRVWVSQDTKLT